MSNWILKNDKGVTVKEYDYDSYCVDEIIADIVISGKIDDYELIEPNGDVISLPYDYLEELWEESHALEGSEAEMEDVYWSQYYPDTDLDGIY